VAGLRLRLCVPRLPVKSPIRRGGTIASGMIGHSGCAHHTTRAATVTRRRSWWKPRFQLEVARDRNDNPPARFGIAGARREWDRCTQQIGDRGSGISPAPQYWGSCSKSREPSPYERRGYRIAFTPCLEQVLRGARPMHHTTHPQTHKPTRRMRMHVRAQTLQLIPSSHKFAKLRLLRD